MVRRAAGLQICVALFLAFAMGPFQHVHQPGTHHHDGPGHDEDVTVVHAHPFGISVASAPDGRVRIEGSHTSHAAWSLDTFTILSQIPQFFFTPTESPILLFVPAESVGTVRFTEVRGHDPPCVERLSPRAPPV
jgi:hypothetical protein